ncbi:MAG: 6,7-dimethyl-8-ribityllumazine synthase [Patescibacteria group bacterium]|nr:6,7-dimethyl-8-ribityllumazine synthase [Patescibacteria group bacterium]
MQQIPRAAKINPKISGQAKVAIITSQYNGELTRNLERHCMATLQAAGLPKENVEAFAVPGALEIPVLAKYLAAAGSFDAIVALGIVLKGETYHFELVANEAARGCQDVAIATGVPVIMEVLACYTKEQAEARAGNNDRNKGIEAAHTALQMITLLRTLKRKTK